MLPSAPLFRGRRRGTHLNPLPAPVTFQSKQLSACQLTAVIMCYAYMCLFSNQLWRSCHSPMDESSWQRSDS